MKQVIKALFVAIILVAFSVSANAQGSATANGNAAAVIIAPITLTAGTTLHFGTIYSATAGTVTVTPAGARSAVGAVVSTAAPAHSAGTFTVGGEAGLGYSITLPADGTVTITNVALNTMAVNGFNHNAGGTPTVPQTFSVGAVLTVGAAQAVGSYTGTYPVTVQYN